MVKVIAFDLFGTVFDPNSVGKLERNQYISYLKAWRKDRFWNDGIHSIAFQGIKPFEDSKPGLLLLESKGYKLAAASNIPRKSVYAFSKACGINWDFIAGFEDYRVMKPALVAYASVCDEMKVHPSEVIFVTGNPGSGDDTEPMKIGMKCQVVRHGKPNTLLELAEMLPNV